jgi:hypothetical protein
MLTTNTALLSSGEFSVSSCGASVANTGQTTASLTAIPAKENSPGTISSAPATP